MNANKIYGLLLLVTGTSACDDALDKLPLDAPSDETFFSDRTDLELAINGAYRDLYWMSGGMPFQILLDNATDLGFLRTDFSGMQSYSLGAHTSETTGFSETWERMYAGIGKCNNLLNNMEQAREVVPADFYDQVEAQALFLRAYYYSWLIRLYGDVPFVTETPDASDITSAINDAKVPRTPRSEIVDALFTDLDGAAEVLPETWPGSDEGRATKGAVWTLKARMALYEGRYEEAAQAAKQVMDMGVYSLYPDYGELFTYAGQRAGEVIFDLPFKVGFMETALPREQGPRNANCWSRAVPSQFMIDSYECTDGLPIDESPLYDPSNPFENRDPRLDASSVRPQSVLDGYVFETHPDSTETTRYVNNEPTRVANQDVLNAFASYTGYLWRKYTSEEDMPEKVAISELNFILMRYAEVLLIYAEANIEQGQIDGSVLDAINQVRARAYGVDVSATGEYPAVTTTAQAELRRVIRRERKIELADEGFRMTDIRRWGIAEHVMPGTLAGRPKGAYINMTNVPDISEHGHPVYGAALGLYRPVEQRVFNTNKDYLWPIPQKDMDVNPELEQNPGY